MGRTCTNVHTRNHRIRAQHYSVCVCVVFPVTVATPTIHPYTVLSHDSHLWRQFVAAFAYSSLLLTQTTYREVRYAHTVVNRDTTVGLLFNLWRTVNKVVCPKVVTGVFDEFNEGDEKSPGVWPIHNQSLQQHTVEHTVGIRDKPVSKCHSYRVICSWIASALVSANSESKAQLK